jgi:O-antigen/teichoic acid export membrane protein
LNACLQQKRQTMNLMFITALNITLNLILIKFLNLSFIGASFASSISSVILFFLNFYYGYKLIKFNLKLLLLNYFKLLGSTAIMAIIVIFLTGKVNLYYNVIIAVAVYLALLLLTKSLSIGEIKILLKSLFKKTYEKDSVIEP